MKLKKCKNCNRYTLRETCPHCNNKKEQTSDAHYKFIKPKTNSSENKSK